MFIENSIPFDETKLNTIFSDGCGKSKSLYPIQVNMKLEPCLNIKWERLADLSKLYTKYVKSYPYPIFTMNEILLNKIIFFNLGNETVVTDTWQRIGEDLMLKTRSKEQNPKIFQNQERRKKHIGMASKTVMKKKHLQQIVYSVMLDKFINNNKQLILIKNAKKFHAKVEKKIESKISLIRNSNHNNGSSNNNSGTTTTAANNNNNNSGPFFPLESLSTSSISCIDKNKIKKFAKEKITKVAPVELLPKIVKYIAPIKYYKRYTVLTSMMPQMNCKINNLPYNILCNDDPIKSLISYDISPPIDNKYVAEAVHFINLINSKLFINLKSLFSTIPLNGYLISYLEKRFATMYSNERHTKEELSYIIYDILLKMNTSSGNDSSGDDNSTYDVLAIPEVSDKAKDYSNGTIPNEGNWTDDEFFYLSTDVDSYKSDSVYTLRLKKKPNYRNLKKNLKKSINELNIAMEKKESCEFNRCTSFLRSSQNSVSNKIILHECYKIFKNIFLKLSNCLNYFDKEDLCGTSFDRRFFEWQNNLSMYDPFLLIHNRSYDFDAAVLGYHEKITDTYVLLCNKSERNQKMHNQINKLVHNITGKRGVETITKHTNQNIDCGTYNNNMFLTKDIIKKGKLKIINREDQERASGRRINKTGEDQQPSTLPPRVSTLKCHNFQGEAHICIYNDSTYFNCNDSSLSAEMMKNDKYEESLLNYNLNRNVHFQFHSNTNCFTLRLKNDYIKRKNKVINLRIKRKQIYKINYIQNVVRTRRYTYFIFSVLVYPMSHVPRIMYLFSIRYFPSLFIKTVNYLSYLKVDNQLLQFFVSYDVNTLNEIFKNFKKQKNSENIFHMLRFKGYYINPFSLLGSIYYSNDIHILCTNFKLSCTNYFNTLHTVLSVENIKREPKNFYQEQNKLTEGGGNQSLFVISKKDIDQSPHESEERNREQGKKGNTNSEMADKSACKKKKKKKLNDSHNSTQDNYMNTAIKFTDDTQNYISDDKINKFFQKEKNTHLSSSTKRTREIQNILYLENEIKNESSKKNKKIPETFLTDDYKEYLSKENINDDDVKGNESFIQRSRNFNSLSLMPNVLALYPEERDSKKRASSSQYRGGSTLRRNAPVPSKGSLSFPTLHSINDPMTAIEKEEDHFKLKYYIFGQNETNIISPNINNKRYSQRGLARSLVYSNEKGARKKTEVDGTDTQSIPLSNDRDTIKDFMSEQQVQHDSYSLESQCDVYGNYHISSNDHLFSTNNQNHSLFSTSHNPSINQMNVLTSLGTSNDINKMNRNHITNTGIRHGEGHKRSKACNRIYNKCLWKKMDIGGSVKFCSNPSETINLYNMIMNSLANQILLKNDSITYGKYMKKSALEFNYIVYKEFTIHTNYYLEPYNTSVLNEFVSIFYTNQFRDKYLKCEACEDGGNHAGSNAEVSTNAKDALRIDHGDYDSDINLAILKNNNENKPKEFNEFFCVNNELLPISGENTGMYRARGEIDSQTWSQSGSGNMNQINYHYDSENARQVPNNGRHNDEYSALQTECEQVNDLSIVTGKNDVEENIRDTMYPFFDDENILETFQKEENLIDMVEEKQDNLINQEKSDSSDFYSEYNGSDEENETNYCNQDTYTVCSFYLHKPVYIFDEQYEIKDMKRKMHNGTEKDKKYISTKSIRKGKREMHDMDELFITFNKNVIKKYLSKNNKKLKKVYKKLIKKMEYDKNAKKISYALYDKTNNFLMHDYKCSKYKNAWGNFTKNYVKKKKNLNNIFNGDHLLINTVSNDIYSYDQEVRKIVQVYKRKKMFIKSVKQKHISTKYKNSFPWIGDNMFVCPNDVNMYIMVCTLCSFIQFFILSFSL